MKKETPAVFLVGECCAQLDAAFAASLETQTRIAALGRVLKARNNVAFIDIVPGMYNLSLIFDPERLTAEKALGILRQGWQDTCASEWSGQTVDIPVIYGGDAGPDLASAARGLGISPQALAEAHAAARYTVYFLGFQPGFAYLGGLPPELACPRLATPRPVVPAGSVAIGGAQTGIYPRTSPGGWQLIGRTALCLFDPGAHERSPQCLLQPGDSVRFVVEAIHA